MLLKFKSVVLTMTARMIVIKLDLSMMCVKKLVESEEKKKQLADSVYI